MRNQLLIFGLILLAPFPIFAQFPPVCASANAPLAKTCAQACIVCDLDGYASTTTQSTQGQAPPDFCTQVVHSMGWIGFVAGSTDLSIQVNVGACTQGSAIEMGMYKSEDCQMFSMVSDCNTFMPQNNSFVFTNTEPLVPGCHYYLVFDNNGPAACPFTVKVLSGSATAPVLAPPPAPIGPKLVCPNTESVYMLTPVFGACLYEITAPSGVLINGKPSPITLKNNELNDILVKWGNTGGKICIRARNACNNSPFSCIDVAIKTIPPTDLPPISICAGQSYEWLDGNNYFSSAKLSYSYQTSEGCDSTVHRKLNVKPPILTNLGNFDLCPGQSITVNGKNYAQKGNYTLPLTTTAGCDSNVIFSINILPVPMLTLYADSLCQDSIAKLIAKVSIPNSSVVWTGPKGFFSIKADTSTRKPGLYTCTATHPTSGCSSTASVKVEACCVSFAGTLDTAVVRICGPKPLNIPHKNDEKLDTNDRLIFLLFTHKNNPWGTAIGTTDERVIPYINGIIQWDTTYYVIAVAADATPSGIDTNSICYSESMCMKVIWQRKPSVQQVQPEAIVCKDGCTDLLFAFSGLPPFVYTLIMEQSGETIYTTSGIANAESHLITVCLKDFIPIPEITLPIVIKMTDLGDKVCNCAD